MLARLLTTLCLAALAAGIDDLPFPILHTMGIDPHHYYTVSSRLSSADLPMYDGPRFYIKSGTCNAVLKTDRLCSKEVLKGIEVNVSAPHHFARVEVDKKNGLVFVHRQPTYKDIYQCYGKALVDLKLSCEHYVFSHSRNRLRLPSLLESESVDSESSDESEEDEGASV